MFDQRGAPFVRIVDGDVPTDVVIDIGAFEFTNAAPQVVSATVDEGGVLARPDLWRTLEVLFDQNVSITAGALSLVNDTLGGTAVDLSQSTFAYNATTFTAIWTFDAASPLPAAFYTYALDAGSIRASGLQLDADGDDIGGDDGVTQHYVAIPGDANLDGQVNVLGDAFTLVGNLGTSGGATWAQGDFNADGNVNVLGDAFALVGKLGQSVIPPATLLLSTSSTLSLVPTNSSVPETPNEILSRDIAFAADDFWFDDDDDRKNQSTAGANDRVTQSHTATTILELS